MTKPLSGRDLAMMLDPSFGSSVMEVTADAVVVAREALPEICLHLRDHPGLDFNYLTDLTSVDYIDYFEVVYHLLSMNKNHSAVLKARALGRTDPWVPSVTSIWKGAEMQEREVWDLMGVRFEGHPNLRRVLLFEGFPGHPLRKDFLEFDHRTITIPSEEDV